MNSKFKLVYQGWSGCIIDSDNITPTVVFDPSPDSFLKSKSMIVFLTHGHPEHYQGILKYIVNTKREPVVVVGSRTMCKYLKKRTALSEDKFLSVDPGDHLELNEIKIIVFSWKHMGLLPDGFVLKLIYLKKLIMHPFVLIKIAINGISGPAHSPMLGYKIQYGTGKSLIYYGEGLHRKVSQKEIDNILVKSSQGILLAAIEPEDSTRLPIILKQYSNYKVYSFEAHKKWRESFGMPQLDVTDFAVRMKQEGIVYQPLEQGDRVELELC